MSGTRERGQGVGLGRQVSAALGPLSDGGAWPSAGAWPGHVGVAGQEDPVSGPLSLSPQGLRRDHPAPCLVCGSLPAAQQCKRCRSFCAAVLQGASFMPLGGGRGGGAWTP